MVSQKQALKFIGSGTFGCIYGPPVKCKNNASIVDPNNAQKIGKIFDNPNYYNEEKEFYENFIQSINANNRFTPRFYKGCQVQWSSIDSPEKEKCLKGKKKSWENENGHQIIMENGGKSLGKLMFEIDRPLLLRLLKNIIPLLEGITKINDSGKLHFDIKPENVLFSSAGKFNLIDFGLLESINACYRIENMNLLLHKYRYYPNEFIFFAFLFQDGMYDPELNKKYKTLLDNHDHLEFLLSLWHSDNIIAYLGKVYDKKDVQHLLYVISKELRGKQKDEFLKTISEKTKYKIINDSDSVFRYANQEFAKKVDVYSIAVTLYELIIMYFYYDYNHRENKSQLPEARDFYKSVIELISDALNANPYKRITMKQLTDRWKMIVNRNKSLFTFLFK